MAISRKTGRVYFSDEEKEAALKQQLECWFSVLSASPVYLDRNSKIARIYVNVEFNPKNGSCELNLKQLTAIIFSQGEDRMTNEEMLAAIKAMFAAERSATDKKIEATQKKTMTILREEMQNISEVAADKAVQRVQVLLENRENKQIQLLMEGQQEILRRLPIAEEQEKMKKPYNYAGTCDNRSHKTSQNTRGSLKSTCRISKAPSFEGAFYASGRVRHIVLLDGNEKRTNACGRHGGPH